MTETATPLHCELRIDGRMLASAFDGGERWSVAISDGLVRWAGLACRAPRIDAASTIVLPEELGLAPGMIDIHVHGARGADAADGRSDSLRTIAATHAAHGTTGLCPTILTSPPEVMLRALEAVREATEGHDPARPPGRACPTARVLGAHLEGPFLNAARAGAQPLAHIRAPDPVLLEELLAAAGPTLRLVTLAPELDGALELVERLVERGTAVAMGHSAATYAEARRGRAAGCQLVTHLFNAMSPLHHREPGLVGAALASDDLAAEIIADGVHVTPPVLRLAWRAKRRSGGLVLVTDCTAALECLPGEARLGDQPVDVEGGAVRLADGTLAGSVLTMDRALGELVRSAGASLGDALAASSEVPAQLLGLPGHGRLERSAPADLIVLERESLAVRATMVGGGWAHPAPGALDRALSL